MIGSARMDQTTPVFETYTQDDELPPLSTKLSPSHDIMSKLFPVVDGEILCEVQFTPSVDLITDKRFCPEVLALPRLGKPEVFPVA